ncbi:MAG: hypothetical protein H7A51_04340 [Akkermansiaceae bacterium]|nr:hypothetical protein [Akkermansiaceae bacterium]
MKSHSFSHYLTTFPWRAFLLLVMVLFFGHWLGASTSIWVNLVTDYFPHHHPIVALPVVYTILIALVFSLYHLNHHYIRPKSLFIRFVLWLLSTLIIVTAYCSATWSEHAVLGKDFLEAHPIFISSICVLGLLATNKVLKKILRVIEGPEDIHLNNNPDPINTLVLAVSLPNHTLEFPTSTDVHAVVSVASRTDSPPVTYTLSGKNLASDIDALDGSMWKWQQLLRAIEPHKELKKVILIGSKTGYMPGSPGSYASLDECSKLLAPYLPSSCALSLHHEALAFEDFNELKTALRNIITEEISDVGEGHVAVDVTGGQATTSIAGAAATIGTEAIFQYVQTNEPYAVLYYDVHNKHAPNPSGH